MPITPHKAAAAPAATALRDAVLPIYQRLAAARERLTVHGDPEALHVLRTSARRARTGLTELSGLLDEDLTPQVVDDLGWLLRALSVQREHDVVANLIPAHIDPEDDHLLSRLRARLARQTTDVRAATAQQLAGKRMAKLTARFEELLAEPEVKPRRPRAGELVPVRTASSWRRARKLYRTLGENPDPERLHRPRNRNRKLRYLLELFPGLHDRTELDGLLVPLREAHVALGHLHDLDRARAIWWDALEGLPGRARTLELVASAGRVDGSLRAEQRRQLVVAMRAVDLLYGSGAADRFPLLVTLRKSKAR